MKKLFVFISSLLANIDKVNERVNAVYGVWGTVYGLVASLRGNLPVADVEPVSAPGPFRFPLQPVSAPAPVPAPVPAQTPPVVALPLPDEAYELEKLPTAEAV